MPFDFLNTTRLRADNTAMRVPPHKPSPDKPGLLPKAASRLLFGSIRVKLIALVLISVLPSLGVITYSGLKLEQQAIEAARSDALALIRHLAGKHQQTVESTRQLVMTLSKLPEVRLKNVPACNRLLKELLQQNRVYSNIFITNAGGFSYASALPLIPPTAVNNRKYFLDAAKSGDFSAGEYVIGLHVKRPVLHFAYPILDARGAFAGAVIAAVDLSRYGELFLSAHLPAGSSMVVSDCKGTQLFACDPARQHGAGATRQVATRQSNMEPGAPPVAYGRNQHTGEAHEPSGFARMSEGPREGTFAALTGAGRRLFAYKRFHLSEGAGPYLFMEVSISEKQALAGATRLFRTNLALLGLAFFVALASAIFIGNRVIVGRLAALVTASRELGKGHFEARTGAPHGPDELGLLARTFDEMAQDLEQKQSDRMRAEKDLREKEARFRMIFEESPIGMVMSSADYRFTRANPTFCRMLGFNRDELASLTFKEITHPAHVVEDAEGAGDLLSGKIPLYRTEKRYIRKDGEIVWGSTTVSVVRDKDGGFLCFLTMIEDITQRRQAEKEKAALQSQLLHAQKMEAVGQLAGGVAHDFNNILMALMGYGNLLQMKMDSNDPLRVYVEHILAATGKAAHLTQSLLAFGRKQVIELKPCKVIAIVKDASMLLRRLLPEDIELEIVLDADSTVMADMVQIDQVLINLATNARDAMPGGGRLSIKATRVAVGKEFNRINGFGTPGEYALIRVTDTGMGMDEKTREKIFEPFFTTKDVGKGTGLGMAIVYGIVKQHAGYITLESVVGRGTVFHIYLPVVKAEVREMEKVPGDIQGGCETILLAEDNSDTRRMAREILGMAGYEVIEAVDGADALEKFMARPDAVDLLVFDVIMPVKGGKEAYDEIKAVKRDARVLFISGYTGDVILHKGLADGTIDLLAKPVSPEGLLTKVRQVLDRSRVQL